MSSSQPKFNSKKFATAFDCYVQIISFAVKNNRRIWSKEIASLAGVHIRSAQRYLHQLEDQGYLEGDGEYPIGYLPTDKAKNIFGVKS
ncbi:hypothetical protein [Acinetobacter sp. NigerLNRRAM0016]